MMKNHILAISLRPLRACLFAFLALATLVPAAAQQNASASQKCALVIGNGVYKVPSWKLTNPLNDVEDISSRLESLGFEVKLVKNADLRTMGREILAYQNRLAEDKTSEGFFWYAGHGIQHNGENYLIPVDCEAQTQEDLPNEAYPLTRLLQGFETVHNRVNIVILDACRNNPLPAKSRSAARGLGVVGTLPSDLVIMYSTAAGTEAKDGAAGKRNSPFAEAFLKYMADPAPLSEVMVDITKETMLLTGQEQRPFQAGSIITEKRYSLNKTATPAQPAASIPPASTNAGIKKAFSPGIFGGSWNGTITYTQNGATYRDTYTISLYDDGTCTVTIKAQDGGTATGEAYWFAENDTFHLDTDSLSGSIPRLPSIKWASRYILEASNRRLKINIKPAPDYSGVVGVVLNKRG